MSTTTLNIFCVLRGPKIFFIKRTTKYSYKDIFYLYSWTEARFKFYEHSFYEAVISYQIILKQLSVTSNTSSRLLTYTNPSHDRDAK